MTAFLFLFMLHDLSGGAAVWIGAQHADYEVLRASDGFQVPQYENNGFHQTVIKTSHGYEVRVEVENQPLRSKLRGRRPAPLPQELNGLQQALDLADSQLLTEQVAIVFHWMRNHIEYRDDLQSDQSVSSVIARRSGNCVGFSNLAIYLLDKLGLQARYVTGLAYKLDDPVRLTLKGNVLHRWIEVRYDDVGWVFSDPSGKINYVEATYLVLGIDTEHDLEPTLQDAFGSAVELMGFRNGFRRVSHRIDLDARLGIRPNLLSVQLP